MEVGRDDPMNEKGLSHHFTVGRVDDGTWLAVSARAPYFCFQGESCDKVTDTANRALNYFFGRSGIIAEVPERKRKKTLSTFCPTKRVNRERECA
jgi:hypothetical protein